LTSFEENLLKSAKSADKSMALQEPVDFVGQFWSDAFRSRDLVNACPAKAIHGPEPL
jgi:hypothetical protein